ncbi:DUF624 domain-containing protein [Clostridium chromiireducens]|uniref:DUF624 domain-containing protein n=1 Tax=Clostridium chromiireducens TaxID=225345 RepID=A0A399IR04_9CLOT|nr:DUF624 domain-containing protein [Clostridium chromiireducens]RII35483.1 DUF624 domain-containing protein [Clostridium chromiireducens]
MSKEREFGEGVIFTITNYVWWFFLGNFYFCILNIPFIFVAVGMRIYGTVDMNMISILMFSSIPIGPALTALLSLMGKLTREGDIDVTKDFFKAYKVNFLDSILFWTLGLSILTLAWVNILFFNDSSSFTITGIISKIMIFACIALGFYIFPIISRFYFKKKDVLVLSLIYLIKKIYVCIICIAAAYMLWFILITIKLAVILPLFSVSILCYLVMLLEKGMLQEIEEKYINKDIEVQ